MNSSAMELFLIAHEDDAVLINRSIDAVCPQVLVHREDSAGLIAQYLQKHQPDILIIDWNIRSFQVEEMCKRLLQQSIHESALLVSIVHNSMQCSRALALGVDHVIDIEDERHAETILSLNFNLLRRLEEARAEGRKLRKTIRTKEAEEKKLILAMEKMLQVRFPESADSLPFLMHAVEWIVEQFRNEEESELEKTQILYATHLSYLGKMHLPDSERHTRVTLDGAATNNYTAFVPLQADAILDGVDMLSGARLILKNMYENYDGTGFPDRKQHWQIPLGSRILRAVSDLDEIARTQRIPMAEALEQLKRFNRHVYDHRIVALLEEYLINVSRRSNDHAETRAVPLFDLSEGMKLASDIVTNSGLKLMNAGTVLRDQLIRRIQSHNAMDPILGNIYIRED